MPAPPTPRCGTACARSAPDTLPIIGRPRAHPNVVLATAHGTLGVSLGPATGEAVAALIGGSRPAVDLHPYRPDRFA